MLVEFFKGLECDLKKGEAFSTLTVFATNMPSSLHTILSLYSQLSLRPQTTVPISQECFDISHAILGTLT